MLVQFINLKINTNASLYWFFNMESQTYLRKEIISSLYEATNKAVSYQCKCQWFKYQAEQSFNIVVILHIHDHMIGSLSKDTLNLIFFMISLHRFHLTLLSQNFYVGSAHLSYASVLKPQTKWSPPPPEESQKTEVAWQQQTWPRTFSVLVT